MISTRADRHQREVDPQLLVAPEVHARPRKSPRYQRAKFVPAMIMKTTIVHCAQAPNGSMERALGEKPPAESVVKRVA